MPREQLSDGGHGTYGACLEASCGKVSLDFPADRVPLGLLDDCGQAAIRDDLHDAVGEQDVNQHAVVLCRVPDTQSTEYLRGPVSRSEVVPQLWKIEGGLDREADFTGVPGLDLAHGRLDRLEHLGRESPAGAPASRTEVPSEPGEVHAQATSDRKRRRLRNHHLRR